MVARKPWLRLLVLLSLLLVVVTIKAAPPDITYDDVLKLVKSKASEDNIRKQLEQSPTHFTFDAKQVAELKKAGASDKLIAFLQEERHPVEVGSDTSDFVIILDCSGSMRDKTPEGISKMDGAKKAVTEFIRELPNGKRLAFIVYGHKLYGADKARGCQAVEVVMPLRELDEATKSKLGDIIAGLEPLGWTPIDTALQKADEELNKSKGMCQLILITDGMESCGGEPAKTAEVMFKHHSQSLTGIDIIGFGVEPAEKKAVDEMVKAIKKGSYVTPETGNDLKEELRNLRKKPREKTPNGGGGGARVTDQPTPKPEPPPVKPNGGGSQGTAKQGGERTTWRCPKGHFENSEGNKWTEKMGDETRHWKEVDRTEEFVELRREDGDGTETVLRLFKDRAMEKTRNNKWKEVHLGKWDK